MRFAHFEGGNVVAWVIWDPFLTAVERQSGVRMLQDGGYRVRSPDAPALAERQPITYAFTQANIIPTRW